MVDAAGPVWAFFDVLPSWELDALILRQAQRRTD